MFSERLRYALSTGKVVSGAVLTYNIGLWSCIKSILRNWKKKLRKLGKKYVFSQFCSKFSPKFRKITIYYLKYVHEWDFLRFKRSCQVGQRSEDVEKLLFGTYRSKSKPWELASVFTKILKSLQIETYCGY
jgi:hypothetical protein